jgi:hypothetical protein
MKTKFTTPAITASRNAKIGVPTSYRNCIIVPVNDGFDVVDKTTGRWMHVPNQRTAKWNATVWTRLSDEFSTHEPLAQLPRIQMIITPKEVTA